MATPDNIKVMTKEQNAKKNPPRCQIPERVIEKGAFSRKIQRKPGYEKQAENVVANSVDIMDISMMERTQ